MVVPAGRSTRGLVGQISLCSRFSRHLFGDDVSGTGAAGSLPAWHFCSVLPLRGIDNQILNRWRIPVENSWTADLRHCHLVTSIGSFHPLPGNDCVCELAGVIVLVGLTLFVLFLRLPCSVERDSSLVPVPAMSEFLALHPEHSQLGFWFPFLVPGILEYFWLQCLCA